MGAKKTILLTGMCIAAYTTLVMLALESIPYGEGVHQPLSTLLSAAAGGTLLSARLIWISVGYFLLCILLWIAFSLYSSRWATRLTLLCAASAAVLLGCLEWPVQHSYYGDDVIAAICGSLGGVCAASLFCGTGEGRWQKGLGRVLRTAGAMVFLAALIGVTALDLCMPAGLVRYNIAKMPAACIWNDALCPSATEATVYRWDEEGFTARWNQLVKRFGCDLRTITNDSWGWYSVSAKEGSLAVHSTGAWIYGICAQEDARDAAMTMQERRALAEAAAAEFLREDERLRFVKCEATCYVDGLPRTFFVFQVYTDRPEVFYLHDEIRIRIARGRFDAVEYDVVRGIAERTTELIPAREAYAYATRLCADANRFLEPSGWKLQSVTLTYQPYRDWLLPAYRITAWRTTETGDTETVTTTVDAVRRF